jgi:hypothetical protein
MSLRPQPKFTVRRKPGGPDVVLSFDLNKKKARAIATRAFVTDTVANYLAALPSRKSCETAAMKRRDVALVGTLPERISL